MTATTIRNVMLPNRGGVFDIDVADGRIARVEFSQTAAEWVGLPPLCDLHLHASRAFTVDDKIPDDFDHAVALVMAQAESFTEANCARQAERTFAHVARKGTARVRTHADVGHPFGMKSLAGSLAAASQWRDKIDIEIVALLGPFDDAASTAGAAVLREAHRLGAGLLGAVPNYYSDPGATIDAVLDLAVELGCAVDLHLDEHLDPSRCWSGHLAASTLQRGLGGRVTLSHGCAIGALQVDAQRHIVDALARAQICVIALPATNLYMQDRGKGTALRRGMAPVKEMIAAGIAVRFASDNIRDAFFPYGSGDMLDIAALAAMALHVEKPTELVPAICDGRHDLEMGEPADLLLVRGASLIEILAERPTERRRISAGNEV